MKPWFFKLLSAALVALGLDACATKKAAQDSKHEQDKPYPEKKEEIGRATLLYGVPNMIYQAPQSSEKDKLQEEEGK